MDVAIEISDQGADIVVEGGDLRADRGLRTAALVSVFCDARANDDEVDAGADPRGWWADGEWGSKLWLLARAKRTQDTLERARGYGTRAFDWMLEQGVSQRVDVGTGYGSNGELGITAAPFRGAARRWQHLWTGEDNRAAELGGFVLRVIPA